MLYLLFYLAFCFNPIMAGFENANRIQPRVPSLFMRRSADEPLLLKFREFEKHREQENELAELHKTPNLMQVLHESMNDDFKNVTFIFVY